ncbi:hypothetical protein [Paraburkholderia guartelaensis]|uniref:hypothetical protein n=1 Tax=Paraburkholderia guartelaensis TaxID=2546446 RepID=UPI002AB6FA9A|nr:hypothetical protein [Paraburkholderia guartelaensis]
MNLNPMMVEAKRAPALGSLAARVLCAGEIVLRSLCATGVCLLGIRMEQRVCAALSHLSHDRQAGLIWINSPQELDS